MDMNNSFEVNSPVGETWEVLTDVEQIAPCLPGASLTGVSGSQYQGLVKVKVGPITAQYRGTAEFVERDDQAHRAVISAKGRDTRGAGNASAVITAQLHEVDAGTTRVDVRTKLTITGRVAQFGRGVMADVSAKLMSQFADNLADLIASSSREGDGDVDAGADSGTDGDADAESDTTDAGADSDAGTDSDAAGASAASAGPASGDDAEAVDLFSVAGAPLLKRLVPVLVVAAVVALVVILVARRG